MPHRCVAASLRLCVAASLRRCVAASLRHVTGTSTVRNNGPVRVGCMSYAAAGSRWRVVGARSSLERLVTTGPSGYQSAGSARITRPQGPQRGSTALPSLSNVSLYKTSVKKKIKSAFAKAHNAKKSDAMIVDALQLMGRDEINTENSQHKHNHYLIAVS